MNAQARYEKLLRLAQDGAATAAERETARQAAARLRAKFDVHEPHIEPDAAPPGSASQRTDASGYANSYADSFFGSTFWDKTRAKVNEWAQDFTAQQEAQNLADAVQFGAKINRTGALVLTITIPDWATIELESQILQDHLAAMVGDGAKMALEHLLGRSAPRR